MNRFLRCQFHKTPLPHVDGDFTSPDISLEASLRPARPLVDRLDHYIRRAKQSCNQRSKHGLTRDESAAIYLYSNEWNNASLHHVFNQALQSDDRAQLKPWSHFLQLFNRALEKLPTVTTTLWRGLPVGIAKAFEDAEEIVCRGVTSCSLSEQIILSMLNKDFVCCSIDPVNGKDVRGYTCHHGDEEVLLLPGTCLRRLVGSVSETIQFEEIGEVNVDPISISDDIAVLSSCPSGNYEYIGQ